MEHYPYFEESTNEAGQKAFAIHDLSEKQSQFLLAALKNSVEQLHKETTSFLATELIKFIFFEYYLYNNFKLPPSNYLSYSSSFDFVIVYTTFVA